MSAPIQGSTVSSDKDEVLGGKYLVPKGTLVTINDRILHRDTSVYGEDVETFRPERMLGTAFTSLPPNCWKPFGIGFRACIGRAFAEQVRSCRDHLCLFLADSFKGDDLEHSHGASALPARNGRPCV